MILRYHLFLLASAEVSQCFLGLWSLVYVGRFVQYAPSLLRRLSRGPSPHVHVSTALCCKETVLLFLQHVFRHPIQCFLLWCFATLQGFTWESKARSVLFSYLSNLYCGFYCLFSSNFPFMEGQAQDLEILHFSENSSIPHT